MQKIISIFLLIILIFSLSACGNIKNTSSEVNTNNSNKSTKEPNTSIDVLEPFELNSISYEIKLEELKNIVDYNDYYNLFITNDGSLYKIGNFSDGTNLKRIAEEIKFVKFSRGTIISDKNDVYIYDEENFSVSLFNNGMGYTLNTVIEGDDYINSAHAMEIEPELLITASLKNNALYLYKVGGADREMPTEPIHCFDEEEKVEFFIDGTIKTNKDYYYFKETINQSQYDDIPTTYSYLIEKISILNDDIIFVKHYATFMNSLICTVDKNGCLKIYNRDFC